MSRKKTVILFFSIFLIFNCSANKGGQNSVNNSIILAENGKANYHIICLDENNALLKSAADDLGNYLQKISKAKFTSGKEVNNKAFIYVGTKNAKLLNGKFSHLQAEYAFSITIDEKKNIYLIGIDSLAANFAVYTFLEDIGCRWFMPGTIGEVIPQKEKLCWPLNSRTEKPDFRFRQIWWAYGGPPETQALFRQWKLRNKVANPVVNHGHNLTNTLPPAVYFKKHPEYYALVNGKRRPTQLCTSNPNVIRLVVDHINKYFDENPQVEAYSLCPDDNVEFCECANCRALDAGGMDKNISGKPVITDRYIHFLNAAARGIQKKHAGKKVSTYAYQNYSTPPLREVIDPHVVVVFTTSVYCGAHGIGDLHCTSRQTMKKDLAGWTKAASEVYIYDYDPIPFNAELPWPLYGARSREMSEYLAMGVKGFSFESHNSWATLSPNFYISAKMMWNADLIGDRLLEDYCEKFFGKSARAMKKYYNTLESAFARYNKPVLWNSAYYTPIFDGSTMRECREHLNRAESLAQTKIVKKRLQMVDLGFKYLETYLQLKRVSAAETSLEFLSQKQKKCDEIIDELYTLNKDFILRDVAHDYLKRKLGGITINRYADQLGLIRGWKLLGPLENGSNISIFSKGKVDFNGEYSATSGKKISWIQYSNKDNNGEINLKNIFPGNDMATAYAVVSVISPTEKKVQLRVGSNDAVTVWLNGIKVWESNEGRTVALDDDIVDAVLPQGESQLVLKVTNFGANWGFCFRITDKEGKKVKGITWN